jgi:lysyl-tRNA synthetase class II
VTFSALEKIFTKKKGQKRKAKGQNLIFHSRVNAVEYKCPPTGGAGAGAAAENMYCPV